jgi:hypothetical protein
MIRFILVLYSVVIFALLALDVVIDTNQARWAFSARSVRSVVPVRQRRPRRRG